MPSPTSHFKTGLQHTNASIKSPLNGGDKLTKRDTAETEEEENEPILLKKAEANPYLSAPFYLLSLLFLFSYLENSAILHKLFSFYPLANRRFVLFQVFRL